MIQDFYKICLNRKKQNIKKIQVYFMDLHHYSNHSHHQGIVGLIIFVMSMDDVQAVSQLFQEK
jgi:hypothetical protein